MSTREYERVPSAMNYKGPDWSKTCSLDLILMQPAPFLRRRRFTAVREMSSGPLSRRSSGVRNIFQIFQEC